MSIAFDGVTPNKMVCDTTLRQLPDGSWILFMLAGGDTEPSPLNYTGVLRSRDQGKTWSKLEPFNVGFSARRNDDWPGAHRTDDSQRSLHVVLLDALAALVG